MKPPGAKDRWPEAGVRHKRTLLDVEAGEQAVVTAFEGGGTFRRVMSDMGLREGVVVMVQRKHWGGPVAIAVGDTRLALGRGMAGKVYVRDTAGPRM